MQHILIVDDDKKIARLLARILVKNNFRVSLAYNAEEARELINMNIKYNLIILDIMLPGLTGTEFAKQLKQDAATSNLPIIMLTAICEPEEKKRNIANGAKYYVTKPFSSEELLSKIKNLLQ